MTAERDGAVCVLARLPGVGPARLRVLLRHHDPVDAVCRLAEGRALADMVERGFGRDGPALRRAAVALGSAGASIAEAAQTCDDLGIRVVVESDDDYPALFGVDRDPPTVLFVRGDLGLLGHRRVGIVGTRNATSGGLATARELGEFLAGHGVIVVSGLARGTDAAAHAGCRRVESGPGAVAVVGSGPDRPYPKRNTDLWQWVAEHGLLVSEYPPGAAPEAWHFPRRNRLIAALSEVVVVVESRERGGSLITAREALDRDIPVMVVPGSPRSPASVGTNGLLFDGAAPVTSAGDVLLQLGLDHRREGGSAFDARPRPDATQSRVLDACRSVGPCTLDEVARTTGLEIADAALAAARLERSGWLIEAGGWFDIAGSRLDHT